MPGFIVAALSVHFRGALKAGVLTVLASGWLLFAPLVSAQSGGTIVLASHRVNPSKVNRDWGTISYKVGLLAQCPVLLVK